MRIRLGRLDRGFWPRVYEMVASWSVKQESAGGNNEENVIVAMTSRHKIKKPQQPRDLGYSPGHYVRLLDQLYLLLFYGPGDQFAFD